MTPLNPQAPESKSGFATGLSIGLGLAAIVVCLGSAGGVAWVRKAAADARKGWNLVPVVVAAQDMKPGEVITFDQISQRSIPEQFVTDSVVKPDSASAIVNVRTRGPLKAGDPLLWSQVQSQRGAWLATRALKAGEPFSLDDFQLQVFSGDSFTAWTVTEDVAPLVEGSTYATALAAGEVLLLNHLTPVPPKELRRVP